MTTSPKPSRRSSRVRKVLLFGLAFTVLVVAAAIGLLLWTDSKIDRIPEEELASLVDVDGPRNILIVGTDSRENLPDDFEGNFGAFSGARTDVIMLVHFIPGEGAQLLSLPRDLKVLIPGRDTGKINAAYVLGGPDLLVETIRFNLNIEINNYIEIDFAGFANLVDALGGIEMTFDKPARDKKSGLSVDGGTHTLDGAQALAFARSRQFEELRDGEWTKVGANDIARTRRQQAVMLALFDQATSPGNALNLPSFAGTVADQIRADKSLSISVLVELGRAAIGLRSGDLEAMTLPVRISKQGNVSYVVTIEPEATAVLEAFKSGLPFPKT